MIKLTSIPYIRPILAAVLVALLVFTHWKAYDRGMLNERADNTLAVLAATQKAIKETQDAQTESEKLLNDKIAKLRSLNWSANRIIDGLRERPSRDTPTANTPSCPDTRCTGAGLFKEDGTFLVRDATAANRVVEELRQCQDQYNDVRKRYNSVK